MNLDLTALDVIYEPIADEPRLFLEIFPADRHVLRGDRVPASNGTEVSFISNPVGFAGAWKRSGALYELNVLDAEDSLANRALILQIVQSFPD